MIKSKRSNIKSQNEKIWNLHENYEIKLRYTKSFKIKSFNHDLVSHNSNF